MADAAAQMVAVDFVGNQKNVVLPADGNDFFDFFFRPDPSHGVGGGAEDQHFVMRIGAFFFQIVKVDGIVAASVVDQMVEHRFPFPFVLHGGHEMTVDRRHEDHAFAFFGEHFHAALQGAKSPRRDHRFFRRDLPSVIFPEPAAERGGKFRFQCFPGVAVDPPVRHAAHGLGHRFGGGQIHIGKHHRNDLRIVFQTVPFPGTGSPSVNHAVKIIFHWEHLPECEYQIRKKRIRSRSVAVRNRRSRWSQWGLFPKERCSHYIFF